MIRPQKSDNVKYWWVEMNKLFGLDQKKYFKQIIVQFLIFNSAKNPVKMD